MRKGDKKGLEERGTTVTDRYSKSLKNTCDTETSSVAIPKSFYSDTQKYGPVPVFKLEGIKVAHCYTPEIYANTGTGERWSGRFSQSVGLVDDFVLLALCSS
ncbi:unnamed protein product [Angiostrongylus costaricensis]|uniref:Uncharacterized protein n=1 Tax=Angiostrongylus costaricensis TaxID=334426 RepID=A0A0R3PHZ0_ANGCS|nr:unnamed protein product [Angiostrongylus costaricensis]